MPDTPLAAEPTDAGTPDDDPIDAAALRSELVRPGGLWQHVEVVTETGSTNADLAARARRGLSPGAVLVTGYQSAGRGRRGRSWTAPPGTSIALSVLVAPAVPESRWTWLPLLTGLAVADGLHSVAGVPARLKWPNDVTVGGRKICGVLAERTDTGAAPACVVGMGINVDLPEADLPVPTATSLAVLQPGIRHPRTPVVSAVLAALELWLRRWEAEPDGASLLTAYREACDTLGRPVEVQVPGRSPVTGTARGIGTDGRLVVATGSGEQVFGAGDVLHLR